MANAQRRFHSWLAALEIVFDLKGARMEKKTWMVNRKLISMRKSCQEMKVSSPTMGKWSLMKKMKFSFNGICRSCAMWEFTLMVWIQWKFNFVWRNLVKVSICNTRDFRRMSFWVLGPNLWRVPTNPLLHSAIQTTFPIKEMVSMVSSVELFVCSIGITITVRR